VHPERVTSIVRETYDEFERSVVRDYIPPLVERIAHNRLCRESGTAATRPCLSDHIADRQP
jgi:hypothetical protein